MTSSARSTPSGRWVISSTVRSPAAAKTSSIERSSRWRRRGAPSARPAPAPARRRAGRARPRGAGAGRPRARAPSSPTSVSRPSGSGCDPVESRARRSASTSSSSLAAGRASSRFSRMLVENRCASWPATAIARRTSSWRYARRSRPRERDAPRLGVEEAQQQVRRPSSSRRRSGRAGRPGARLEPEAEAVERRAARRARSGARTSSSATANGEDGRRQWLGAGRRSPARGR